jgi:hypothetical protein
MAILSYIFFISDLRKIAKIIHYPAHVLTLPTHVSRVAATRRLCHNKNRLLRHPGSDQLGGQMSGSTVSCITARQCFDSFFCAAGYRTSPGVLQRYKPVTALRLLCELYRLMNPDIVIRRAFGM